MPTFKYSVAVRSIVGQYAPLSFSQQLCPFERMPCTKTTVNSCCGPGSRIHTPFMALPPGARPQIRPNGNKGENARILAHFRVSRTLLSDPPCRLPLLMSRPESGKIQAAGIRHSRSPYEMAGVRRERQKCG